jgi:hypothetical protein
MPSSSPSPVAGAAHTGESARSRSRSPARDEPKPKKKLTGFKYKDKKPANNEDDRARDQDRSLNRGYRDRSPRRDSYRDRSPRRDRQAPKDDQPPTRPPAASTTEPKPTSKAPKSKKPKFVAPAEPMIIVNINDRLGTKAAIPCLASDSIKAFKAIVAANIGRQPHEIMLKRQGERPFKDILTLADYGVSNGVQLDLEIDTGD